MTSADLVTVYEVADAADAQIIKNALTAEGIRCALSGEEQASTAAIPGTTVQIQVTAGDVIRAREFLHAHEQSDSAEESADQA
jgi:hypothetical protein